MTSLKFKSPLTLGGLILLTALVGILLPLRALPALEAADDPVFRAMGDELNRSMNQLVLEGMPSPYFLAYLIKEVRGVSVEARFGSLTQSDEFDNRSLCIELRVGSPELDNSNFYPDWQAVWNYQENLVAENDYDALRHQLWLHTDKAYKDALENLARKKAFLQANPPSEILRDFSPVKPYVQIEKPQPAQFDLPQADRFVKDVSAVFDDFQALLDWQVQLNQMVKTNWFLNSEGSQNRIAGGYRMLEVKLTTLAADGERLSAHKSYIYRSDEPLPAAETISAELRKMCSDLSAVQASEPLEEYEGPVLFVDDAAAQFVSHLFVDELSLNREILTDMEWLKEYLPYGRIAKRVQRRVFPDFVTVVDDPGREEWGKTSLAGCQSVDDQGVPSQTITLVKDGWLQSLPMTRAPTRRIAEPNGHARMLPIQMMVPAVTNLIVSSDKPLKEKKLLAKFRSLCKEYGNEYGLMITQLDEPFYTDAFKTIEGGEEKDDMLPRPVLMFKVYANDGRMEPVRGLVFDEVTIRTLRDICALGSEPKVANLSQGSIFDNYRIVTSIVAPSILVEEMEFKAAKNPEPMPYSGNPLFTDK